jgi:uncharacterized protein (DUF342 family)
MEENKPSLWFVMNEVSGDLQVNFDPDGHAAPNPVIFRQAMEDAGYGGVQLLDGQLNAFLAAARTTKEVLIWLIGKRRDAEISIRIDDDWMSASLTIVPAQGGKAPTLAGINDLLRTHQISHGILHAEIDAILAAGSCENRVIARGQTPVEGQPTRFESLLEQKQHELSHIDEMAVVKFRDLSHLLLVEPGDHLMRRYPPVAGSNGINIKGEVAFAPTLDDLKFATNYPGAAVSPLDPDLLIATLAGQPTPTGNGVGVNPVVNVESVDLSVGNIEFEGTLNVAGDVIAGMRIKVTGDVIIQGTLEAAEVIAGGNVAVGGGIVGHADARHGAHGLPQDTARIRCKGSLQAMFVENAHIEAGDSIFVERSVRQCELIALNDIIVGKAGSKLSQIVGGTSQAKHLIRVLTLGSSAGIKTHVQIGHDPYADDQIETKERFIKAKHQELDQVQKLLAFFKVNPKKGEGGIAQKVDATRAQLIGEIGRAMLELEELRQNVALDQDARVEVGKMVYFGTEVKMDNKTWQAKDDISATIIGWEDGQLTPGIDPSRYQEADAAKLETNEPSTVKVAPAPVRFG